MSRRPHLFRYSDVLRIVQKVQPGSELSTTDLLIVLRTIIAAERDLLDTLRISGKFLAVIEIGPKFILEQLDWLFQILQGASGPLLDLVVKKILDHFGIGTSSTGSPPAPAT